MMRRRRRSAQIFQKKIRNHLKILVARRMTWSQFHTENPQILDATVQDLVPTAIWRPGFLHPCLWSRWQTWLTHSVEQNPSREANRYQPVQVASMLSYTVSQQPATCSRPVSDETCPRLFCFLRIHFNNMLASPSVSFKLPLSFSFPHQHCVYISVFPHAFHIPQSPHSPG